MFAMYLGAPIVASTSVTSSSTSCFFRTTSNTSPAAWRSTLADAPLATKLSCRPTRCFLRDSSRSFSLSLLAPPASGLGTLQTPHVVRSRALYVRQKRQRHSQTSLASLRFFAIVRTTPKPPPTTSPLDASATPTRGNATSAATRGNAARSPTAALTTSACASTSSCGAACVVTTGTAITAGTVGPAVTDPSGADRINDGTAANN